MSVLSREELFQRVTSLYPDATSDEAIEMLTDLADTYDSLSARPDVDWQKKYEENDRAWRERYRERFFNPAVEDNHIIDEEPEEPSLKTSYDELFTTKED